LLKQKLSPAIVVVLIVVLLLIVAGVFMLLMHRGGAPDSEAPAITNDPYAGQISGPPTQSNPEPNVAP